MSSSSKCRKIVILGSSGSIGENALHVVETLPDRFRVIGLSAQNRVKRLVQQARQFNVRRVAVADENAAEQCRKLAPELHVLSGPAGVEELAADEQADVVLVAVVGIAGLKPVLSALGRGADVALATKEALVAGGRIVKEAAARTGARIIPVDSEHSAVLQCLEGRRPEHVRRIILTASGGPFFNKPHLDLNKVTVSEALAHPTWNMGRKVTVDSATMMNKGLELIEARWLFDIPVERINILIHPESIVHSMVEFIDGSVLAQLSSSDMRFAIQYALTCPDRTDGMLPGLDLVRLGALRFACADEKRFPCLRLARDAAARGGTMPAAMNAANEAAVSEFLNGNLAFSDISRVIEKVMNEHIPGPDNKLEAVLDADGSAKREAMRIIRKES